MLVSNWMTKDVITINVDESMHKAVSLMKRNNIRLLPVVKKGALVGIVTDRDLKRASASDATSLDINELLYLISTIKIKNIMSKRVISIPDDFTVEETAEILLSNKISGAPVVDSAGALVGVITQTDIFKVLISLTGVGKKGVQFAFQIEDRPGSIKDLADIIRKYQGRMLSILSSYDRVPEGHRNVYIRIQSLAPEKLQPLKTELRQISKLLYVIDHREGKREIY